MKRGVRKSDASNIAGVMMPEEMSDWLDYNVKTGNYIEIEDGGATGYLIKSESCTIAFFPNWNCDEQVSRIANKLDGNPRRTYY